MYTTPCANQKLHVLADHVPSMLASWDKDLRCRFANRAYKTWFGADPARLLGTSIRDLLGPDLFRRNEPFMRAALAGEEQVFERVIPGPDGVDRHSLARYTPEFSNGGVVGFFVEVTDVSRLKSIERSLRQDLAALKGQRWRRLAARRLASNARKAERLQDIQQEVAAQFDAEKARRSEFLAVLAHELRNALAPVDYGTRLLSDPGATPEVARSVRAMMTRQVGHMSQLVGGLLDLSSLDAGVFSVSLQPIDLREAIEEAIDMSLPLLNQAGHAFALDAPTDRLPVSGDRTRLVQVFTNLLNNAAKYTPPGGRISLAVRREGEHVRVSVQDNGVGLPQDAEDSIFEMFTRLPESARPDERGLGIGLALVRRIVRAHGGTVTAQSDGLGSGSKFSVVLPLAPDRRDP